MKRATTIGLAAVLSAAIAGPALAQSGGSNGTDAARQLQQVQRQMAQEADKQADRVEVSEKAIWGLGELPPHLMSEAVEEIATDPEEAGLNIMQAANILQLHAATAPDGRGERLRQAARDLRRTAWQVQFRQTVTPEALRQEFARAAMAGSAFFQQQARQGLEQQDAEQTGYSLKLASTYLTAAHAYAGQSPEPIASLAAYNANLLGEQIVKANMLTTYEVGGGGDNARQAGAQQGSDGTRDAQAIPPSTSKAIEDLDQAIRQTNLGGGDGAAGSDRISGQGNRGQNADRESR